MRYVVDVKSMCGLCLEKKKICSVCYPDIKSARALHMEMPAGFHAHCEKCHGMILKMHEECCDGIVVHWRDA